MPDAIIEERFLGPADLAHIFAATVLNIHPCLYDAFGMTIVEAGSQGSSLLPQDPRDRLSIWSVTSPVTQDLQSAGPVSLYDRLKKSEVQLAQEHLRWSMLEEAWGRLICSRHQREK